ncbi:hypothetical protein A2767_05265 [Candidatus Roizmanbacteria bacterium RIFCSPHIGHO2_01_FULL_35_10]|uniref:DUF1232 domain-containing protein n=1 Tax=Candidatus Roizmanbacteria bacterium RIFCSPLOWO2_01_FULL_35_13 TaxID=1802055 RepID=A0A1F7IBX4_9BACT|nr:MAG: hypothetical protein A2767_05265 [Candidatus Roizmanbacteria bacterium RIFCSPHIGHO2_01_FULL_35_10]OGK40859.1 MAG: hypothetical protein A3A74_05950 [Candidatus Roizmanbacteria bacterium RIFCSPLOWO2_01_FULL_35_13]
MGKLLEKINVQLRLYKLVISDKRTPKIVKVILVLMIGYALFPFDFISDFIPVLGLVDDLAIIFSLIWLTFSFIPKKIVEDSRKKI